MTSAKVLLIKPDYRYFPIGFAYIITALERAGIPYKFIDCYLDPNPNFHKIMQEDEYIAVASGGLIGNYTFFINLFRTIKSINSSIPCILGGNITIDLNTTRLLTKIPADFLVIGEGDITFPLLLERLLSGKNTFSDIKGLAFRSPKNQKGFVKTPRRPAFDLSKDNRILNWDFFDRNKYGFQTMPVLTGRGCTGRCSFCSPTNGRFRGRPLKHILEEIEYLNSKYEFVHFVFMNEIFFPDEESIYAFCKEYKKIEPFKKWHCLMRMDINPNVLDAMHDAGCTVMNVGVESGSNRVLKIIKKDLSTSETRSFVKAAKQKDIVCQASFMMANYDENEDDIKKTIDLMLELQISGPMALTINYPGTLNYVRALKKGLIPDEDDYLDSLDLLYSKSYYQVISGHLSGDLNYLNLSAMPDNKLFSVVEQQMRRYYTEGFCMKNTRQKLTENQSLIELIGNCPFCDQQLTSTVDPNELAPLDLRPACPKCGEKDLTFHPLEIEEYAKYFAKIKDKILTAKRPIIVGGAYDSRLLLMFDFFGIQFDKLLGFIAHREMPSGYVLTHRLIPFEKALELAPDLFIFTESIPLDIISQIGTQNLETFLKKSVMLSMGGTIPNKTILATQIPADSKILIISSGPIQLLELLLPVIERPEANIHYDILIQRSREHILNHFTPDKKYLFADGLISQELLGQKRIEELINNRYDIVVFLANNDRLKNYQKVRQIIKDLKPKYTMAFPIGNAMVQNKNDAYLIDLSTNKFTNTNKVPISKMHDPDHVFVYQMGRVGSTALCRSFDKIGHHAYTHCHWLRQETLNILDWKRKSMATESDLMVNTYSHYQNIRFNLFNLGLSNNTKVITIFREPVSHFLSTFFMGISNSDTPYFKRKYGDFNSKNIIKFIQDCCDWILDNKNETLISMSNNQNNYSSLQRFMWYTSRISQIWFDDELSQNFDVDVYSEPFDHKGWKIINNRFLILKFEALGKEIDQAIANFLKLPKFTMISANTGKDQDYGKLYSKVKSEISFSDNWLDFVYNSKYASHFYSTEEINTFYNHWKHK